MSSSFITNENIDLLWEIILEEEFIRKVVSKEKIVEFRRLLSEGRRFIKVTQQELESHSTQVTQDLLLTFDDIVPRQGISFV